MIACRSQTRRTSVQQFCVMLGCIADNQVLWVFRQVLQAGAKSRQQENTGAQGNKQK